jgi:hypothetical protein
VSISQSPRCRYCQQTIRWQKEPIGGGYLPYEPDGNARHKCDAFYESKEAISPEIAMSRLAVAVNRLADALESRAR